MIFVTVGTHEQPFDRLIKCVDELKQMGIVEEDVVIQTGFSTYVPQNCKWQKFFSYQDMIQNVNDARIIITHGGPSSFIMPLQAGKTPLVVPRMKMFDEHINDHQVMFCKAVEERLQNIIVVRDIEDLEKTILHYDELVKKLPSILESNNQKFCYEFVKVVNKLFEEKRWYLK